MFAVCAHAHVDHAVVGKEDYAAVKLGVGLREARPLNIVQTSCPRLCAAGGEGGVVHGKTCTLVSQMLGQDLVCERAQAFCSVSTCFRR